MKLALTPKSFRKVLGQLFDSSDLKITTRRNKHGYKMRVSGFPATVRTLAEDHGVQVLKGIPLTTPWLSLQIDTVLFFENGPTGPLANNIPRCKVT